jgi:hypothetical protein
MTHQHSLFPYKEMAPKAGLRKIVTKERIQEMNKLLHAGDTRGLVERLEDLNDRLERFEQRIKHKHGNSN